MRLKRVLLGALVGVHDGVVVAIAAPGFVPVGFAPSFRNTTTSQATATASCAVQCSVEYPPLSAIQWVPQSQIVYTEKVVVATVTYQIITSGNSTLYTKTVTNFDDVRGYSLYQLGTAYDGTAELTLTIPQGGGVNYYTTLTYPTPYLDYYKEYRWQGVLSTSNKDSRSTCETATAEPANVPLPSHPEYPQPKGELSPGKFDQLGLEHQPLYIAAKDEPDGYWFQLEFPSEAAFSSCKSISTEVSIPTQYEAPLFITASTTVKTSAGTDGIVIIQPSATGWEETSRRSMHTPDNQHVESTASNLIIGDPPRTSTRGGGGGNTKPAQTPVQHIESSATNLAPGVPQGQQTGNGNPQHRPSSSQGFGDVIASLINNNPSIFPPGGRPSTRIQAASQVRPGITPPPAGPIPTPTPVFTFVPTVINGRPTTVPAFILPGSSETATIGQTVTINGQPTVLAAPPAFFTVVPTTVNGVATVAPAFIISGTSTASVGQTVTLDGQTTVLSPPAPFFTFVPTTINGIATSVPAFIIDGTSTATLGQTITLPNGQTTVLTAPTAVLSWISTNINGVPTSVPVYIIDGTSTATPGQTITLPNGQTTVLSAPSVVLSWVSTNINGVPTSVPVYIIDGTSTATAGQTVVINGTTTVLPTPTGTNAINTELGGPVATRPGAQASATGNTPGAGSNGYAVSLSAVLIAIGSLALLLI